MESMIEKSKEYLSQVNGNAEIKEFLKWLVFSKALSISNVFFPSFTSLFMEIRLVVYELNSLGELFYCFWILLQVEV